MTHKHTKARNTAYLCGSPKALKVKENIFHKIYENSILILAKYDNNNNNNNKKLSVYYPGPSVSES